MKASELRIGNKVNFLDKPLSLRPEDLVFFADGITIFEPITLTPEWLIKAGFEKLVGVFEARGLGHGAIYNILNPDSSVTTLVNNPEKGFWYIESWGQLGHVKLYHVHQLQNLYFALTGEELQFKD